MTACTPATQITMAADATTAYIKARAEGKDVAILCDTWEIADAINQRLHDHFTDPDAPSVQVARDQQVRAGDLIISRHNDATLAVHPGTHHRRGAQVDQVRNGNRWRVIGVDTTNGAASPPSGSPIRPASSSTATICASTSPSATPAPCTPRKA